jgi:hypothetical protein
VVPVVLMQPVQLLVVVVVHHQMMTRSRRPDPVPGPVVVGRVAVGRR